MTAALPPQHGLRSSQMWNRASLRLVIVALTLSQADTQVQPRSHAAQRSWDGEAATRQSIRAGGASRNREREDAPNIESDLARLDKEAAFEPKERDDLDISEIAGRVASTGRLKENLAAYTRECSGRFDFERLTLPPKMLTQEECRRAALLYRKLFNLVRDERKLGYGALAVDYMKQYVILKHVRDAAWEKAKEVGLPIGAARTFPAPSRKAEWRPDIFEYHQGYYCLHLWLSRRTSLHLHPG